MKDFVFISDFDGTISRKDFYWEMIDKYMKEEGNKKYKEWQEEKIKDIDFLGYIFKNINQEQEIIHKDILEIEIDPYLKDFIDYINDKNGDFIILSAGSSYYINIILEHLKLQNVTVYSNKAIYKDRGLHYDIDPTYEFYSERYGIDKKKVVEHLKTKYKTLYYAGDSMPDFEASLICDKRFATGKLIDIFNHRDLNYYAFNSFKDIKKIINEEGI